MAVKNNEQLDYTAGVRWAQNHQANFEITSGRLIEKILKNMEKHVSLECNPLTTR